MSEIERARKKRSSHRRNATKLVNKVNGLLESDDEHDKQKLQHFKSELKEIQLTLKQFDDEILDYLHENADMKLSTTRWTSQWSIKRK